MSSPRPSSIRKPLLKAIEQKVARQEIRRLEVEAQPPTTDLVAILKASLGRKELVKASYLAINGADVDDPTPPRVAAVWTEVPSTRSQREPVGSSGRRRPAMRVSSSSNPTGFTTTASMPRARSSSGESSRGVAVTKATRTVGQHALIVLATSA